MFITFLIDFFLIWGPFWEPFGRPWGDFWLQNRARVSEPFAVCNALVKISSPRRLGDPIWDHFGTILGPFWYHFGTIFLSWQPQGDQDSLPSPPAPRHHRATKHRATMHRATKHRTTKHRATRHRAPGIGQPGIGQPATTRKNLNQRHPLAPIQS